MRHVLQLSKKKVFKGFFLFFCFLTKESLILSALKQKILDEIEQSNGKTLTKIKFFISFCKFFPRKGNICWKVPLKIIYTFYLKHQKYAFCAPIIHPLSETESYVIKNPKS